MSKGGGDDTKTVVNKTEIPAFIQNAMQNNIGMVSQLQQRPYQQYTGEQVAPIDPATMASWGMTAGNVGQQQGAFDQAKSFVQQAGNTQVGTITPQTYANGLSSNLSAYMNPYTQNVIDASMANMDQAFRGNLNTIADQAQGAGAFGGSRQGVQEGAAASQYALGQGQLAAQLNQQGFTQASQLMGQDIGNNMAAQQANQSSALDQIKNRTAAGLGLGQLAQSNQASQAADAASMNAVGQQAQSQRQNVDAADSANFQNWWNYPTQMAQLGISAVGNTPFPSNTTSTSTGGTSSNPGMGALGGLMAGGQLFGSSGALGGIGSALGLSSGAASGIGSVLGGLLGFMSDRDTKTDIEKLGKDPQSGLDMYAYRYKNDPKHYPKVVGPMAQDIEKKAPGMTRRIGGKMIVTNGLAGPARKVA